MLRRLEKAIPGESETIRKRQAATAMRRAAAAPRNGIAVAANAYAQPIPPA